MTVFHLPTAYLVAGTLFLAMPAALWFLLRHAPSRTLSLWSSGSLIFGASLIILGFRSQVLSWIGYGLANGLLFTGAALWVMALRNELGRAIHTPWAIVANLFFVLVYEIFNTWLDDPEWRFIWSVSVISGLLIWVSALAYEIGRRDTSASARMVGAVYLVLGVVLSLRGVNVLLGWAQPGALSADTLSVIMIVMGVVTSIIGNIGFLGMVMERLAHDALVSAQAQARQEEASRLMDQMAQLDRRRSMGEIAASLGHELSQPLTNICLILDRMDMALSERKDISLSRYVQDMNRNAQKAGDILDRIRSFIRAKERVYEPVEIGQVISDVTSLIHDLSYNESIQIEVAKADSHVWVHGDSVQLSQILMNVLRNAIEATANQAHHLIQITTWKGQDRVFVTVSDNGPGLPIETAERISTPFFSTKPEGLGVGLSIAKSIAKQHGGVLNIHNQPGGGAIVQLELPALASTQA